MSAAIDEARDAVARAASALAERIPDAPGEDAEVLKGKSEAVRVLAEATERLHFGPSGGSYQNDGEYHSHTHPHEVAPNGRRSGFGQ